jgi:hypothetical protein
LLIAGGPPLMVFGLPLFAGDNAQGVFQEPGCLVACSQSAPLNPTASMEIAPSGWMVTSIAFFIMRLQS